MLDKHLTRTMVYGLLTWAILLSAVPGATAEPGSVYCTSPSVALGAVRDGLLTLTTLHSIVVSTAFARAGARRGKQAATMARLCQDEGVV
jgi:hypothetical protein